MRRVRYAVAGLCVVALVAPEVAAGDPDLTVPAPITAEATGPDGAAVTYTVTVQGTNAEPPTVECDHASGSVFPLGETTVTCTAKDPADGSSTTKSFAVTVQDTTPPAVAKPANVTVRIDGRKSTRVAYPVPTAHDVVDGDLGLACKPPPHSLFGLGTVSVTCTATDSHGNAASVRFDVTVVDETPPPKVTNLVAKAGKRGISVVWRRPPGTDVARMELARTPGLDSDSSTVVYHGTGTRFYDRKVKPGTTYTYEAVAVDRADNRSDPVDVTTLLPKLERPKQPPKAAKTRKTPETPKTPKTRKAPSLFLPAAGARVTAPPLLRWPAVKGADYYNVQLFRRGTKVLSIWPRTNRLRLTPTWIYEGKRMSLSRGTYQWYVWPGFGPLANSRYGKLIVSSTFVFAPSP